MTDRLVDAGAGAPGVDSRRLRHSVAVGGAPALVLAFLVAFFALALVSEAFAAQTREEIGTFGPLVRVTKSFPASKPALAAFAPRIRQRLTQQALGRQLAAAAQKQQQQLRAATVCRSGYVIALCANGPKVGR